MDALRAIARHLDSLIGYASMRAIESPSVDDQQWLTYWVLYSFLTLFEQSCWEILQWLPLWSYMKLVFCMWLVLPVFNGAAYIYGNMVRRYIKVGSVRQNDNFVHFESQRKVWSTLRLSH